MAAASNTLHAVREEWPHSYIMWRTAPMTRVELETGAPGAWHKEWAFKMHIAQINAVARHVAALYNIPLIDVAAMGSGMTPAQGNYGEQGIKGMHRFIGKKKRRVGMLVIRSLAPEPDWPEGQQ